LCAFVSTIIVYTCACLLLKKVCNKTGSVPVEVTFRHIRVIIVAVEKQ